ncbi:hypothetical protein [Yoonia sp.]|uniref:hypothetical protein n=1 Tax=Yoonia sp. TaxID=2212373 RepID=UPI0035C7E230
MTRDAAIAAITDYFDVGRFQSDLAALVAYPSESQSPGAGPELLRYLTEAMLSRLTAAGFACEIFDSPLHPSFRDIRAACTDGQWTSCAST